MTTNKSHKRWTRHNRVSQPCAGQAVTCFFLSLIVAVSRCCLSHSDCVNQLYRSGEHNLGHQMVLFESRCRGSQPVLHSASSYGIKLLLVSQLRDGRAKLNVGPASSLHLASWPHSAHAVDGFAQNVSDLGQCHLHRKKSPRSRSQVNKVFDVSFCTCLV